MVVEDGILLHVALESNTWPSFVLIDLRVRSLLREIRENYRYSSYEVGPSSVISLSR